MPSSSRSQPPGLYFHSNHILRSAFQDFSRHDAPMHRCSRAPELTSSATNRATHHQSVTDSTARQSSSHQLLLRKVQHGTACRGTVLHLAASPASPVDGTNALPPPRIVSSYRPTPGHLQLHMLRGTAHPNLFGPLSYLTAPEFTASSLAPWLSESVRLRLAVLTFGTVRYIVVQSSYSTRTLQGKLPRTDAVHLRLAYSTTAHCPH